MNKLTLAAISLSVNFLVTIVVADAVQADAISPGITGNGQVYSKEAPNSSYFGTGVSGRLSEASTLRFEGEQETASQNYDTAIHKLSKAVQLDPADPTGHLLYARAISAKIYSVKNPDLALVNLGLSEWRLIWHHDADLLEQFEGNHEARRLAKLAKVLSKQQSQTENPKSMLSQKSDQITR